MTRQPTRLWKTRLRTASKAAFCAAVAVLVLIPVAIPAAAHAQDEPADGEKPGKAWAELLPCTKFESEMQSITEESATLKGAMPDQVDSRDALLAGIFQGTQIMLGYGERMFETSDEYEEKCKAALRENNREADIIKIYELVLTPTVRGYDFLVKVRDSAQKLDDQQTVDDMNAAIEAYRKSAIQLVDYCESDLPEGAGEQCSEFGKRMNEALAAP